MRGEEGGGGVRGEEGGGGGAEKGEGEGGGSGARLLCSSAEGRKVH